MAKPQWGTRVDTPASFGSEAARKAPPPSEGSDAPQWGTTIDGSRGTSGVNWAATTGQNQYGPNNAFDTEFWNEATRQDQEQSTRGMADRWTRPDATGVAVYNDEANGVRFGDVYLRGQKQGNLRDGYAGMDAAASNQLLARLTLPRETVARAYQTENGKPLTFAKPLDEELARVERENTENYAKGRSAEEFQSDVRDTAEGYAESDAAQGLNVAGGAAGGAAVGAGIGSIIPGAGTAVGAGIGAAVGGLVGGLGAWFNRDEVFQNVATASEQYRLATADGHQTIGIADAATGYVGVATGYMSPLANLYRGGREQAAGAAGDGQVQRQIEEQSLGSTALDFGAMLADGIGSFGTRATARVFTGLMGTSATTNTVGWTAGVAEGNVAFNPYSGQYEDVGALGMAQLGVSTSIDWAQTFMGRGVVRTFDRGSQSAGGFRIVTDARTGERRTAGLSSTAFVPSEMATGVTARMFARRSLRRQGQDATPDAMARETARYIDNLATGRNTVATAVVNGFGEGAEEVVQAVLGATAFGETPTFEEIFAAARQGFALGAGAGVAVGRNAASAADRLRARSDALRVLHGQEPVTDAQWTAMSEAERALAGTASNDTERRILEHVAKPMEMRARAQAFRSVPEVQRVVQAAARLTAQEQSNSQAGVETSRMQSLATSDWAPEDYVISLPAAVRDTRARLAVLEQASQQEEVVGSGGQRISLSPEQREQAGQLAQADRELLSFLMQGEREYAQAGDETRRREVIAVVNRTLREWWHAPRDSEQGYGRRRAASVLAGRYPFNAAGSQQLLRLQISPALTAEGNMMQALVSDDTIVPQGGDFDGDRMSNLLRSLLPDESYDNLRFGSGQLTSDGTMIEMKPNTEAMVENMHHAAARPGSVEYAARAETLTRIGRGLHEVLDQSSIPADVVNEMVDATVQGIGGRNAKSVARLLDLLATQYAAQTRELAEAIDASPFLRIMRLVEDELREFNTQSALRGESWPSTQLELPKLSKRLPRRVFNTIPHTSDLLTAVVEAVSTNAFRVQTILKYNSYREATEVQAHEREGLLNELVRTFAQLNDGIQVDGRSMLDMNNAVQEGTQAWLTRLAADHRDQLGSYNTIEAAVVLAGMNVADTEGAGSVSLLQSVMHEVIVRQQRADDTGKEENARRYASLDRLTRPAQTEVDGSRTSQAGNAFVEVFGAYPVTELVGDAGANVGTYTVRALRDTLVSLRSSQVPGGRNTRQEFEAALRNHPQWEVDDNGRKSPYRVMVEQVIESARQQLTEKDGLAHGALAASSNQATRDFVSMHDSLRQIARGRNMPLKSADAVARFLAEDGLLANQVFSLMTDRGIAASVRLVQDPDGGTSYDFPAWIYQMLAESNTARAEMILLRETLVAANAALDKGDGRSKLDAKKVDDRILRLWLDLSYRANDTLNQNMLADSQALDDFVAALFDPAATVDSFIRKLNTDIRYRTERTPPYMPWARDRAAVEPSRYSRGVTAALEGTTMREALRDAAQAAKFQLQQQEATREWLESDESRDLMSQLTEARDNPDSVNRPVWDRFVRWVNLARDLPTMVGASIWIEQASGVNELRGNMGEKGKAPENVQPLGAAVAAQIPVFDSGPGRLMASLTSGSMHEIVADAANLQRNRTIVLADGTVVHWDGLTPERALDLLGNERTAGIAARALGMTAWDFNPETRTNSIASVFGTGVAGMVADPAKVLFGGGTTAKLQRLQVLEAKAAERGGKPIIPTFLAQQMNVREAALGHVVEPNSPERTRMVMEILEDLADTLQDLTTIRGQYVREGSTAETLVTDPERPDDGPMPLVNLALRTAARKARTAANVRGNDIARMLPDNPVLRQAYEMALQTEIVDMAAKADGDLVVLHMAKRLKRQLETSSDEVSPLDVLLSSYRNFTAPEVQQTLMTHLEAFPDIARMVRFAAPSIERARDPETQQVQVPFGANATLTLPDLTPTQWEDIARAVIAFSLHTSYGLPTDAAIGIPTFPSLSDADALAAERSFWDPTFVELGLDMFVPGVLTNPAAKPGRLLMAQIELMAEMGETVPRETTREQAAAAVDRFIAPQITDPETGRRSGVTGPWHVHIPTLIHSAVGSVMSSAAEQATQMAGIGPQRLRMLSARTRQDWSEQPSDTELSSTSMPADSLIEAITNDDTLDVQMPVTFPDSRTQGRSLAQLEGRVVRSVTVTLPDGREVNLLGNPRYASGLRVRRGNALPASEGGILVLDTLRESLTSLLNDNGVQSWQWGNAQVDVSFFHPETKTTSATRDEGGQAYSHNPWFDGVIGGTDAALSQESLLGTFFFGVDGEVARSYNHSLKSIKKLTFSLQQATTMPEAARRVALETGLDNMAEMLHNLTSFALKQRIDGKPLGAAKYNAIYKLLSLMYVVRHVDNGQPAVLSAEQVIALQQSGGQLGEHAEVVGLPLHFVLGLMGERDASVGYPTAYGDLAFSPDVSQQTPYLDFPAEAWTDSMFGGLLRTQPGPDGAVAGWASADLLNQHELRNLSVPRTRAWGNNTRRPETGRDLYSGYRAHQEQVDATRMGHHDRLAEQRAQVEERVKSNPNIGQQEMRAVQLAARGDLLAATRLTAPPRPPSTTYDLSTAWEYQHYGAKNPQGIEGRLSSEGLDRVRFGDTVYVPAEGFMSERRVRTAEEVFPEAREVLSRLMGFGATIGLPPGETFAEGLRSMLRDYVAAAGYIPVSDADYLYEPAPSAARTRSEAAYASSLKSATIRSSQNRVPISLSIHNEANENAILSVNGGIGGLEDYFVREVVQTARYAGYAPVQNFSVGASTDTARQQFLRLMIPLLNKTTGHRYLVNTSGLNDADTSSAEAQARVDEAGRDLERALENLRERLITAESDPDVSLLPRAGDEFGTGDIIPLVSYRNGKLSAIHLHRHGHEPVSEELIAGEAFPPGNAQLGLDGVRLTIDSAFVDVDHTSHRGTMETAPQWLGQQGFVTQLRVKTADLGSKVFEALSGMKWVTAPAPESLQLPSHALFGGRPVLGAADPKSPQSKDAQGWWLDNTASIVEVAGFDTMPFLVRALTGIERDGTNDAEYATAAETVMNLLDRFRRESYGLVDAADVIERDTDQMRSLLRQALQEQLNASLAEMELEWGVDLQTLTDDPDSTKADVAILTATLSALATGAPLDHVMSAPGYLQGAEQSHTMHPVFTTLIDQSWAARQAVADQVNGRMPVGQNGYDRWELTREYGWIRHVRDETGRTSTIPDMLAFPEIRNTGHNDALAEQALERKIRASASDTSIAMQAVAWGAAPMLESPLQAGSAVFASNPLLHSEQGRKELAYNRGNETSPMVVEMDSDVRMNEADQQHIFTEALPAAAALAEPIRTDTWYTDMTPPKAATARRAYEERFDAVRRRLNLGPGQAHHVEWMLRAVMGRPADTSGENFVEPLTHREAMAALKKIEANIQAGLMPTRGGAVNVLPRNTLEALMDAGYELRNGKGAHFADGWNQWVEMLLLEAFSADPELRAYTAVTNMIDGVLYEYRGDVKGLPATVNNELTSVLNTVRTRSGMIYASPFQRARSDAPTVEDGRRVSNARDLRQQDWVLEDMPQEARAIIERRMASWEAKNGLDNRKRQSPRAEAKRGAQTREDLARTNTLVRLITSGYVLKTFINPGLWASGFLELGMRGAQERVVSTLAGESVGTQGFTPDQRRAWRQARDELAKSPTFYRLVYENTNYQEPGTSSGLEHRLQKVTNFTSALVNDPTWGTRSATMANRFMEAAWSAYSQMPLERHASLEQFLEMMTVSPELLEQTAPEAVNQGFRRIEYARGLQDTLLSRMVRQNVESIVGSGGWFTATFGALALRLPTLFFRFRANTIINMMGLQAPHALLTTLMSDRTKRAGGLKDRLTGASRDMDPEVTDTASLEDSMDLTRAIIRSGVSHTQLFLLGSLVSAAGFGGDEDDESKLLAKLERYQQTPVAKDPLSLENDFRNAEAWFSNLLPGGMAVPSWIMKMFVDPVMGVARFRETGDFRQVYWGFLDALGSMPLLNMDNVINGWETANELSAAAESMSQEDGDEAVSRAEKLLLTAFGTLESMMFESAFASMLYQAGDEFDRDPYVIPLTDSDGTIQRFGGQASGVPRPTDALVNFQDPVTGETRQGYASYSGSDAALRALAENRPVLAHVLSLIKKDSTYIRTNMPAKMREVKAEALNEDEAMLLVMSVLNEETGREEPTLDGQEAVIRGVHVGALALGSPALNNFYITDEQRYEIQKRFLREMTAEYLEKGYSKSDATRNAERDYYGQGFGEPEATGLADILWSDAIPKYENQQYMQLNTTYVMGPNGRPVATGLQRGMLASIGLLPYDTYHNEETSNLGVDQLLNSVDEGRGINLGWRGLTRVDETWETPTPQEIGESVTDALAEISEQLDDIVDPEGNNGWRNYGSGWRNFGRSGWRRSGGYGGRGGGYSSRGGYGGSSYVESWGGSEQYLRTPQRISTPYSDDLYSINTSNPIIRRATIRRERFASQRGRLNQWQ